MSSRRSAEEMWVQILREQRQCIVKKPATVHCNGASTNGHEPGRILNQEGIAHVNRMIVAGQKFEEALREVKDKWELNKKRG